jgi:integrase
MNTNAEIAVVYNYKGKDLSPDELAPIHIKVYRGIGSKAPIRKMIATGFEVKAKEWDAERGLVTRNPNSHHINKVIRDMVTSIENFQYSLLAKGKMLTLELLEEYLNDSNSGGESFTDFFRHEIDPLLKRGTRKEHNYTYNLLVEFRKQIRFDEVNLSLIQEFDRFMRAKGLRQNTIHKHHQHINRFIRLATLKELFQDSKNPYNSFKSIKEKSDRINLSPEELKRIEELQYDDSYPEMRLAKDLFLFSCYTGLRFSDVESLEKDHLIEGIDGLSIYKKMEKVPKPIVLPLDLLFEGKPRRIINQYLPAKGNYVFPRVSNQHINRLLKSLALDAKIKMRLTFHISRHTFGSLLADLTQNPYLIMDLMGHSDIKTSMIYIHRSQERINRQLRSISWKL